MMLENVADVHALSPTQQLMLTHALVGVGHDTMQEQLSFTLAGRVDGAALRRAWELVVARHDALRSAFVWEGLQKPLQVVHRQVELPWRHVDGRHLTVAEQQARWSAWLAEDRAAPIALSRAPLMRLGLFQVADDRYRCVWSCHHTVLDGWCLGLLLREVFECHEAVRDGRPPRLPEPVPFRNYIAWLAARGPDADAAFWRDALAGWRGNPPIGLLEDGAEPPAAGEPFGEREWSCPVPLDARLRSFAAAERVTLGTLVEACWCLLLARLSGGDDVVFGSAVSGRPPELRASERIVGAFANALPVRVRIEAAERWGEFLRRFQAGKAELHGREHAGLDQIRRWSDCGRPGPLFESLVAFENYPLEPSWATSPREVELSEVHGTVTSDTPLLLAVLPGRPLQIRLRQRRASCSDRAAERLLGYFVGLLENAPDGSDRRAIGIPCGQPETCSAGPLVAAAAAGEDAWSAAARTRLRLVVPQAALAPAARAVILDAWGEPALAGVPGDLRLEGGAAMSGGEFASWIDTGERARRGVDGRIHFLGRRHDALDVRGHRLEAGWLGGLLAGHPLVADAAVVAPHGPAGREQLAAYVVPVAESRTLLDDGRNSLVAEEVRRFLAAQVPREIVPRVVTIPALPRLPDGGLDHAALPPVMQPRPGLAGAFVAPRDFFEKEIADIWSELLGIHPIGVHDRFADLGGRSILAVSLIARIQERFARTIPIVALYGEPTIANLAEWLRRAESPGNSASLVPIQPHGSRRPLVCVHPAGGTVFCYAALAKRLGDDQPVYGLQARGVDGLAAPHTSVQEMASAYVAEIRGRFPAGPYRLCGWSTGGIVAFEVACQLQALGETVELLALLDAGMPVMEGRSFGKDDTLPLLAMMFPGQSHEELAELQQAGPERQLEYFRRRAETAQLVVGGAGNVKHVYDVFQANVQAVAEYRPARFSGVVLLFRAAVAFTPMHGDSRLGWGSSADRIDVIDVVGDHLNLLSGPALEAIAAGLATRLRAP